MRPVVCAQFARTEHGLERNPSVRSGHRADVADEQPDRERDQVKLLVNLGVNELRRRAVCKDIPR